MTKTNRLTTPRWLRFFFSTLEKVSPYLTFKLATLVFFSPFRFKTPSKELQFRQKAKLRTTPFSNNRVVIYEWGQSNTAVLLVHGWSGRATQVAHLGQHMVKAGYKVISFDAPAHGQSNGRHTHFMEFAALIQEMKSRYPEINYVVGHSMGGTAVGHALSEGLKIEKAVIIGAPASTNWVLKTYCEKINVSPKIEQRIKQHIENKFDVTFEATGLNKISKKLTTACLIIHCEDDQETPVKDAHIIHSKWKNSTLAITTNLGHRRILKDTTIAHKIINFLN